MGDPHVIVCRHVAELENRMAEHFASRAGDAVGVSGCFSVALSGGSTPQGLYTLLASPRYRERIPWPQVHLFWGDERCVPPDHPQSNYRMVRDVLLSTVPIPAKNVHRMAGEKEPAIAAAEYQGEIEKFFRLPHGGLPRFDLILLGVGEDGHTASLFPGTNALQQTDRLVIATHVPQLDDYRLTLTLPVLNAGAEVVFLVSGSNKATVVRDILAVPHAPDLPAAKIRPTRGRLAWFITEDAAGTMDS